MNTFVFFCVFDVFFRFGMGWPTSLNQRSWPTPMTHFQKVDSVREIRPFLSCFFVWNDSLATGLGLKVTYNFFSMFQLQDVLSGTVQCVSPFCFDLPKKKNCFGKPGKTGFFRTLRAPWSGSQAGWKPFLLRVGTMRVDQLRMVESSVGKDLFLVQRSGMSQEVCSSWKSQR